MISNLLAQISNLQGVTREALIGKSHKDFSILSFQIWVLSEIHLKYVFKLSRTIMIVWASLDCLSALFERFLPLEQVDHLSNPCFLKNHFKNILIPKMILNLFIPQRSLICPKPNLFRHICYFLVGQITTFDLQWRASHYLKWFLWPNIHWNKIVNI